LASNGGLAWAKTFGGPGYDYGYSIVQTADGGYAVAGATSSYGAGAYDCLVLKLASDGGLAWAKTFGGAGLAGDGAYSIVQTTDGGYAVAGYTDSYGAGSSDFLVLKLASDGSLTWAKTFGGAGSEFAYSIVQTTDGGYAVAGYTSSFGAGGWDLLVIKLDPDGSLKWAKTFGGANSDYGYLVTQTADGGYAVAGSTLSFGAGAYDALILKLSSDGSLVWAKTFGGASNDEVRSITRTTDGGYAVAGYTSSFGAGGSDILVLRLASDGNYTGCVEECSPTVMEASPNISSPSLGVDCAPTVITPTLAVITLSPTVTDPCEPLYEGEEDDVIDGYVVICSPISRGVLFRSSIDIVGVNIYSADGRLILSKNLTKGENRINLEQGVYLWIAESYKGKAVVR